MKTRLDVYLFEQGLAESREKARSIIIISLKTLSIKAINIITISLVTER